ncbi:MAG TPA: ABC transporter permease [Gammaproteobacteria bacterium]
MIRRVRGIPRQFRFPWRTRSQVERDVDDELEFHIAMRAEELERAGRSADAARREALRGFGNFDAARRELARTGQRNERQTRWLTMLEDCWRDVRYGARSLARSPGFTAVAIIVLAVGIGANSAAFSLVNVLVRPTLIANADDVVAIFAQSAERPGYWSGFSYPEYADLRELNRTFADLAAFTLRYIGLADDGITNEVRADFVSANFFRTLGVPVAFGREFTVTEEAAADAQVAIVSHAYWKRHGSDPAMLGSVLQINGQSVAVIGIAAEGFTGHTPLSPELWLPLGLVERFGGARVTPRLDDREGRLVPTLIGRIAAGATKAEAEAELDVLAERLNAQYPPEGDRQRYLAAPLPRYSIGNAPDADEEGLFFTVLSSVLIGLSGTVLLIACINLANMFLARETDRRTEIAIRQALGGGRLRLVRQLLAEGLLLSLAGGVAGMLVAYWAVSALLASIPTAVGIGLLRPEMLDVRPGAFVLTATVLSCLVATVLFGLGPAWKITRDVAATLQESAGGRVASAARRARTWLAPRNVLVIAQVALSLALLTAGGLFLRGTIEAGRATPGFDLEPIALAQLDPALVGYDEPRSREVLREALERARALPGVESASLASMVPFDSTSVRLPVQVAGSGATNERSVAYYYVVTDDYFRTLGLPMLAGRTFTAAEASSAGGSLVAVIDEPLAERLFGGTGQALGRFIEFPSDMPNTTAPPIEVVGVVPGTRHRMTEQAPSAHAYLPFGQVPTAQRHVTGMHLHIRAAGGVQTATLLEPLRNELMRVDSALPVLSLQTMIEHRNGGLFMWSVRAAGRVFSMLGGLALFLAVVGAYGVKAFLVTRRTREIGVRLALGATPRDVMRQMLRESLGLTIAGLAVGLLLAAAVARFLSALLYGVSPIDPLVLTVSAAVLAAALLLAAYLPTRRATRIDPTTALRHE